jgi:hypothetical protein
VAHARQIREHARYLSLDGLHDRNHPLRPELRYLSYMAWAATADRKGWCRPGAANGDDARHGESDEDDCPESRKQGSGREMHGHRLRVVVRADPKP